MNTPRFREWALALSLVAAVSIPACPAGAQSPDAQDGRPAFSLASSHIATTRERPTIGLMFRQVRSLDFRVYRVEDPLKFFTGLRDPHALGSEAPVVQQDRTLLERITEWKAARRETVRSFLRRQLSHDYRRARSEGAAKGQISLRQPLDYRQFAQVPLLNRAQLVTSWRETLPPVREAEARQIPLDLPGEGVYVVEAVSAPLKAYTVVIVSNLGLVTKASPGQLVMFAADRFTGEPASGCPAAVIVNRNVVARGMLDGDGLYEAAVPDTRPEDIVAMVRCGKQVAATDPGNWFFQQTAKDLTGYIYTDKPIYRPGHTVNIKGVLRWRMGDALAPFDRKQVEMSVADPNDKVVFRQLASVDEFGSVLASVPLPRGAALGYYAIRLVSDAAEATGGFEVQEYRKPDFEVIVKPAARFVMQGGKAVAIVNARYYFGQPVANGLVNYVVHKQPYYSPLRWADDGDDEQPPESWWFGGEEARQGTARLDEKGAVEISVPLDTNEDGRDYSVRIEARVIDASSREVAGNTIVHATFGRFMLAARADSYAYRPGSQATVSITALDYLGAVQPNVRATVALERLTYDQGQWEKPRVTRVSDGTVTTGDDGRATWTLTLPGGPGNYRFRAEAASEGRVVSETTFVWISGHSADAVSEGERELELVPDKKTYQPGEIAHLAIKGGASSAAMLVTKEARQVGWRKVVRAASSVIDVPIGDGDLGDIYVNLAFLKDDRLYRAEKRLKVPAVAKQLNVTVLADQPVVKPGQPAMFTVKVQDQAGRPVRAQVSLGVIDEAVYGVKPETTADPLRFFYRREYSRVGTGFSRDYSFIGYSGTQQLLLAQRHRPMALADFKGDRPAQPQVRKEFPDAIYWTGNLVTGADGTARVQFAYPDALTTWRVTARAVTADTLVGTTVARTTVTKDLIVRMVTPRFLTEGDEVVVPIIVHNYLPATKSVSVAMKANGVAVPKGQAASPSQTIEIGQSGEARNDWRFAADRAGTAVFTASAKTDADSDALELSIPILPFGLKRTAGAAGSIAGEGDGKADLVVPASTNPAARTIRVSLAPSLAGPMLGALDFLTSYPYGCTEQTLSSFLPNLLVTRALNQLNIAPAERLQALDRQVSEGLRRLYDYQHDDGGWGWWKTDENHPFMTAYAVYGLVEAQRAGYKVDEWRLRNGTRALKKLFDEYPRAVPDLKAYMAYVLAEAQALPQPGARPEDRPSTGTQAVEQAWVRRGGMTAYGQALLLLSLDALEDRRGDEVAHVLTGRAQKKGDLVWWSVTSDPLLDDYGDTSVEATAFVVKALSARDPRSPLLEPAVRWLLLNRNYGAWWSSTKQTAMALYGLLDYMRARGEGAADSSIDVLVNGTPVATRRFTSASFTAPDPIVVTVPALAGSNTVVIHKKGGGTLYWSAAAEYYDTAGASERTGSRKLAIVRRYYSLAPVRTQGRIVYRETPLDGNAQPGDLLLVRVDAAGSTDWRYLVIEDPLPAGVEAVQQRNLYELERKTDFWDGSRREYRDDRVVFFQESFAAGHYQFVYLLKVTTPGVFRAMPAQIAAMYVPDATASSEPQTLTVGAAPRLGGTTK
ncbi:MAG TPA: MG2 domain-containing protein [Vicinamibacterales bacterium]